MALITTTEHVSRYGGFRIVTRWGRWLDDVRATSRHWLIKQRDGGAINVYRAVVDDFGNLVPVAQLSGFVPSSLLP